jgi:hypothetical protein
MQGISPLVQDLLASLEGICSMESLLYEKPAASQEGETLLLCVSYVFEYDVVVLDV